MTHTTTQRFIVTIQPMNGWQSVSFEHDSYKSARTQINQFIDKYNIENWDGKEGGGAGYDVRIELESE